MYRRGRAIRCMRVITAHRMFGPRWLQVQHRFRVETAPILQAMPRNRFTASPSRASAATSASARGENGSISMVEPLRRQSAAARPAGDRPRAGPRVTQPDARPAGEITVTGRTVARQIAPGQFGQGGISIRRTGVGQPVAHQRKGMVGAGHRPAPGWPAGRPGGPGPGSPAAARPRRADPGPARRRAAGRSTGARGCSCRRSPRAISADSRACAGTAGGWPQTSRPGPPAG